MTIAMFNGVEFSAGGFFAGLLAILVLGVLGTVALRYCQRVAHKNTEALNDIGAHLAPD